MKSSIYCGELVSRCYVGKAQRKLSLFVLVSLLLVWKATPAVLSTGLKPINQQEVTWMVSLVWQHHSNVISVCLRANDRSSSSLRMPPFLSVWKGGCWSDKHLNNRQRIAQDAKGCVCGYWGVNIIFFVNTVLVKYSKLILSPSFLQQYMKWLWVQFQAVTQSDGNDILNPQFCSHVGEFLDSFTSFALFYSHGASFWGR